MSIAWATVVCLILLLPGFFYFVGLYAPERVTRETSPSSPLGQLAGVVGISFLVHGVLFLLIQYWWCKAAALFSCIDLEQLFLLVRLEASHDQSLGNLADRISRHSAEIISYISTASGLAFVLGFLVGKSIEHGWLPFLVRHAWMNELIRGKKGTRPMLVFILTKTENDGRVLMYEGRLVDFFAAADGTISHLVLRQAKRMSMLLNKDGALISNEKLNIAESDAHLDFLVVRGEDISNFYFKRLRDTAITEQGTQDLEDMNQPQQDKQPDKTG